MSESSLESFKPLVTLGILALLNGMHYAAGAAAPPARIKVLTLKQNHYVLGDINVQVSKNAIKMYNAQNDVTIMATLPDRKVREFSEKRKILFERTLEDFLTRGSSANWDVDDNIFKMRWFPAPKDVFLGRKARLLISPINPGPVGRLLQQGKTVDLEKHKSAHYWYMPAEGFMKEAPAVLAVMYRLPMQPGFPLEMECKLMGSEKPFWQQERSAVLDKADRKSRKILSTKSISANMEDAKLFEFRGGYYKRASEESEIYLTKDTNTMLENMFAPEAENIFNKPQK